METVGSLLKRFLESRNLRSDDGYPALFRGWTTIVHGHLATHSKVVDVKNTYLIIEVDHPGWRQMILIQKDAILKKIHLLFPELEITNIKTILVGKKQLGQTFTSTTIQDSKREETPSKSVRKTEKYEEDVVPIQDEKLRSVLCNLYRHIIDRSNSD